MIATRTAFILYLYNLGQEWGKWNLGEEFPEWQEMTKFIGELSDKADRLDKMEDGLDLLQSHDVIKNLIGELEVHLDEAVAHQDGDDLREIKKSIAVAEKFQEILNG